jgi:hypothetical protein
MTCQIKRDLLGLKHNTVKIAESKREPTSAAPIIPNQSDGYLTSTAFVAAEYPLARMTQGS